MKNLKGGMLTFFNNFTNHPKSTEIMKSSKLYLSSKKQPIGSGNKYFIRIDGVYFHKFSKSESLNKTLNNYLLNKNIFKNYQNSQKVIFQSKFSKNTFFKILNPSKVKESTIIYNGTNKIYETPRIYNSNKPLKIITCSVDHPTKRLHYFFELEKMLKKNKIEFEITIITAPINYKQRVLARMKNFKNYSFNSSKIIIKENLSKDEILSELINSNLYISFSHIDPCPNSIIEAISVGLPIIAPTSGSMSELCLSDLLYKKEIPTDFIDLFNYELINKNEINACLNKIFNFIDNKHIYYKNSFNYKDNFLLDKMIEDYVNFMS